MREILQPVLNKLSSEYKANTEEQRINLFITPWTPSILIVEEYHRVTSDKDCHLIYSSILGIFTKLSFISDDMNILK